jgi:hypothetical protein
MTIPVRIEDGTGGTSRQVKLTELGELLTRAFDYSSSGFQKLDVINTAFNFVEARGREMFLLTDVILNGDQFVSVNGANVTIYEAASATTTSILKTIITVNVGRNQTVQLTGLQLDGTAGVFINAQTSSVNVNLTIAGYFVPVVGGNST